MAQPISLSVYGAYRCATTLATVGHSAPDFELIDGTRVGALLRDGKGILLQFDPSASLQELASIWRKKVTYVPIGAKEQLGLSAVLLRPDGFVAWVSEGIPCAEALAEALTRWFGESRNDAGSA